MSSLNRIDISFNFRLEVPGNSDIDRYSPTLKRFHRTLWSKQSPNGEQLDLQPGGPTKYLVVDVAAGRQWWSSDSITNSYLHATSRVPVASAHSELALQVRDAGCTIGAYAMFPSNVMDRKPTINGVRGMSREIADRFDLTLECIRRHYEGQGSPLSAVFERYRTFFDLFVDFRGYIEFWLLDDWLTECEDISWLLPFNGFGFAGYPQSEAEYRRYAEATLAAIHARNIRIDAWSRQNS